MLVKFLGKGICIYRTECVSLVVKNSSLDRFVVFSSGITVKVALNQLASM